VQLGVIAPDQVGVFMPNKFECFMILKPRLCRELPFNGSKQFPFRTVWQFSTQSYFHHALISESSDQLAFSLESIAPSDLSVAQKTVEGTAFQAVPSIRTKF
jgi:hypothetical protein